MILNEEKINEDFTFEFVTREYLNWYIKRRKSSSYLKVSGIINLHLLPQFSNKNISSIQAREITSYQNDIINHVKNTYRALCHI